MIARTALGLMLAALPASAQPPPDPLAPPPPAEPTATAVLVGDPVPPPPDDSVDVVAGFPLAVRYQRRLGRSQFWGEVGGGLLLIVPDVFAGVRADWGLYHGRRHSFRFRPGVDAHLVVWPFGSVLGEGGNRVAAAPGVAVDADLVWRREGDDGCAEFGLKLGVLTLIGRREALPLPTFGVLCGYRY